MQIIRSDINIDFMGKKYFALAFSAILIIIGMVAFFVKGLNYGVDFEGGIMAQVKLTSPQDISKIRDALKPVHLEEGVIQLLDKSGDAEYIIRAALSDNIDLETLNSGIVNALDASFGKGAVVQRLEMVGPKVGKTLRDQALFAIFYSILLIAVYISGRFEQKWMLSIMLAICLILAVFFAKSFGAGVTWLIAIAFITSLVFCWVLRLRYAMSALMSLIHDTLIVVGAFAFTGKEMSLTVVAAILTLIGYSLNDTIVTFDRIREHLRNDTGKKDLAEIANRSVNETLSRTILTSGTVFAVVVALFFMGGIVIHDFAFAMLIGTISGVYSTVFIASPCLLMFKDKPVRKGK